MEKSYFTTQGLPPERRHDAWRESIGTLFDVSPVEPAPLDAFNASVKSYLWNNQLIFGCTDCGAQRFERSPLRVARDALDYYLIQTHLSGSQELRRGSRAMQARPGDLMLIDLAERHSAVTSDFSNLTLIVPRKLLAPHLLQPDSQHGHVLRGDTALTEFAIHHLHMLYRVADRLTPAESLQLIEPTLMLMASTLNGSTDTVKNGASGVAHSLLARARMLIDSSLHETLTVDGLCRALRISRTVLYRLFEPIGGVRAYIQDRRLKRCAETLLSPRYAGRKILEIAFDVGFRSEAHFSRAFKQKYGMSPSEARRAALTPQDMEGCRPPPDTQVGDHYYEHWLRETLRC